jgi:lipid II:glycine glycyltransferase (peptidoglycan interpeptide bridge formation enzyme)
MEIREVTEKEKAAFNKAATHPLQSWEWGEFRKATGNRVVRFGVFEKKKLIQSITITIHDLPFTYFQIGAYIKGGELNEKILEFLKTYSKKQHLIFLKLEPNIAINSKQILNSKKKNYEQLLKRFGAVRGRRLFTPTTFWIDLKKEENELLKSFSPKTRYNIRVAEKHGVKVEEDDSDNAFNRYLQLTRETSKRQGFYAHNERYHRLMWDFLNKQLTAKRQQPVARLLKATYKNEIITTWILFVWHDFLYYPYGASTEKHKNVMANNLTMWEAIKLGRQLKLKTFDLWGREEQKGFSKFKEGYNPEVIEFLGTWDLVTSPIYWLYRVIDSIRWIYLRLKSKVVPPGF